MKVLTVFLLFMFEKMPSWGHRDKGTRLAVSITIEIIIETASRLPQGWAPWVGSPGLNP